jgi:hypothetical protein
VTDTQKSGQTWLHFLDGEDAPAAGTTIEIAVDAGPSRRPSSATTR